MPKEQQLEHMGLSREKIAAGCTIAEFEERWREFLGEDGVLATWNKSTIDFLRAETGLDGEMFSLKSVYCNARRTHCGALDAVLRAESLQPVPSPFPGRPGVVMSQLSAIPLALGL